MKKLSLLFIIPIAVIAFMYFSAKSPSVGNTQSGILPNPTLTPGSINPDVTQDNIQQTICVSGWTATIRPPNNYTTQLKIKQIQQYGYKDTKTADYEEDHLISLELGGSPTSESNLWPEPYNATVSNGGARTKDSVENYLHKRICAGKMTLAEAQKEISTNWVAVYNSMDKTFGATENVTDEDDN